MFPDADVNVRTKLIRGNWRLFSSEENNEGSKSKIEIIASPHV